jgi:hypothetical protein
LEEIMAACIQHGLPHISRSTLNNYISHSLLTVKNAYYDPARRNAPDVKTQRKEYVEWFLNNQDKAFVFIDEFGFSMGTRSKRGLAPKGRNLRISTQSNRSVNKSVAVAIEQSLGIVHSLKLDRAFHTEIFNEFIKNTCTAIISHGIENAVIVLDNCPAHSKVHLPVICFTIWD